MCARVGCAVAVRHVCVQNNSDAEPRRRDRRQLQVLSHWSRPQPRLQDRYEGIFSINLTRQEHDQNVGYVIVRPLSTVGYTSDERSRECYPQ